MKVQNTTNEGVRPRLGITTPQTDMDYQQEYFLRKDGTVRLILNWGRQECETMERASVALLYLCGPKAIR